MTIGQEEEGAIAWSMAAAFAGALQDFLNLIGC